MGKLIPPLKFSPRANGVPAGIHVVAPVQKLHE